MKRKLNVMSLVLDHLVGYETLYYVQHSSSTQTLTLLMFVHVQTALFHSREGLTTHSSIKESIAKGRDELL